jgi:hypothetical protein
VIYIIASAGILASGLFGAYLLFTPMEKLVSEVAFLRLPMPKEGSAAYSALRVIWRSMGVMCFLMAAIMAYIIFLQRT